MQIKVWEIREILGVLEYSSLTYLEAKYHQNIAECFSPWTNNIKYPTYQLE